MGLFLEFGSSVSQEYILLQDAKHLPPHEICGFWDACMDLPVGLDWKQKTKNKKKIKGAWIKSSRN
jgi:hypothetical protein